MALNQSVCQNSLGSFLKISMTDPYPRPIKWEALVGRPLC